VAQAAGSLGGVSEAVAAMHALKTRLAELVSEQTNAGRAGPEVLDQIIGLVNTANTVQAAILELLGSAERSGVCLGATGAGLGTWLGLKANLTRAQASRMVLEARRAARFGRARAAALSGAVNQHQAEAITGVLRALPHDLGQEQSERAEGLLVELAGRAASDALARAGEHVLEQAAPAAAQAAAEDKAERQLLRAQSKRFFTVRDNFDGTATLKGLLASAEAERVRAVVDKIADKARRQQAGSPAGRVPERRQARADALVEVCAHAQGCPNAAPLGGAGARVVVVVKAEDLPGGGRGARLLGSGQRLADAAFAALACDSDVMRAVVRAKGQILDVGRATRTIPKGLRAALAVRDRGCSFPGCDRPAEVCDAHHIRPWRSGGTTNLSNTCLLCPTHHRMVEPPRAGPPVWAVRLADDGRPEFVPPPWFDPDQKPLTHHRHHTKPGPRPDG
jgi:hypothetical protein